MTGLRIETDEGIVILTLDRPDARNAFDLTTIRALRNAVEQADADPAVRALVLTGAGGAFCAGGDVREMTERLDDLPAHFLALTEHHHAVVERLLTTPKPVVTAVDGVAAGGGLGLALAGDLRLGGPRARFRAAFLPLGVSPDGGSTWLLPRLAGAAAAQRILYRNDAVDAEEARRLGLLTDLVEKDVRDAAVDDARRLADLPGGAFGSAKRLLRGAEGGDLRAHLAAERAANAESARSPELADRIRAFTEAPGAPGRVGGVTGSKRL